MIASKFRELQLIKCGPALKPNEIYMPTLTWPRHHKVAGVRPQEGRAPWTLRYLFQEGYRPYSCKNIR